jgi:hypothetical protein
MWFTQYTSVPSVTSDLTLPIGLPLRTVVGSQKPALHVTPDAHAWPHAPQLLESSVRSAHDVGELVGHAV